VFEQLKFIEDRQFREKYVVTVGPTFPPDTPRETIADSLRTGIDRMVQTGWLNPSSPFTTEVVALVRGLSRFKAPGGRRVVRARPGTDTEGAVATALRFSLNIGLPD